MKWLTVIFGIFIRIINVIATILTILLAFRNNYFSLSLVICIFVLIFSTILLYIQWQKEHNRLQALRILAHRGKVNTINYMIYLDFLKHKFHDNYDNEPKTNDLIIGKSKFSFHFLNRGDSNKKHNIDVKYKHTFCILKHKGRFDILILHALGELVSDFKQSGSDDNRNIYITYQEKEYLLVSQPCTGDMRNQYNQILDRVQCPLPAMEKNEEALTLKYRINKEFDPENDDVFIIYPQNYGKKFKGSVKFEISFDKSYFADIRLLTLPYNYMIGGGIQSIAQFESKEDGKKYECEIRSLKEKNMYMIAIIHG